MACIVCGTILEFSKRSDAVTCSGRCRVIKHRCDRAAAGYVASGYRRRLPKGWAAKRYFELAVTALGGQPTVTARSCEGVT